MTTSGFFRVIDHDRAGEERRLDRRRRRARRSTRLQTGGPGTGPTTLLLIDPDHPGQLTARSNRGWGRLLARLLAPTLDRQLAQGRPSESSHLSAVRAQALVSPAVRCTLAENWESLVVQAHTPPALRDSRVPINRAGIIACEPEIQALLDALLAPLPVPARGVAMASWLLADGAGPVYDPRYSADLGRVVREATTRLDPSVTLAGSR